MTTREKLILIDKIKKRNEERIRAYLTAQTAG